MSQDDKYSRIIEGLAELKGTTTSIKDDIIDIKQDVRKNTKDLEEHIAGVKTNTARLELEIETRNKLLEQHEVKSEERYKEIDQRLQIVEFLPNLAKGTWKVLKWAGIAAASSTAIWKAGQFFGLW